MEKVYLKNKENQTLKNKLKREMQYMLNEEDLVKILFNFDNNVSKKIIKYPDLVHYSNINELLPENRDYRIIFIETTNPNTGHWVLLMKNGNTFYFFDSYGLRADKEFEFLTPYMRKKLHEQIPLLTELFRTKKNNQKIVNNMKDFQSKDENVNTCGRWVAARLIVFLLGYTNKEFYEKMKDAKENLGLTYDELVCQLIR
jgi:hypothetical protein